jgi:hypothetical protein
MTRKPYQTVQLKLRFPEKLRLRIQSAAERSERSMNSEIVHRLEKSFEKDDLAALVSSAADAAAKPAAKAAASMVELALYAIFRQLAESKKLLLSEDEHEELLVRQSLLATAPHLFTPPTGEGVSDAIPKPASTERKAKAST